MSDLAVTVCFALSEPTRDGEWREKHQRQTQGHGDKVVGEEDDDGTHDLSTAAPQHSGRRTLEGQPRVTYCGG